MSVSGGRPWLAAPALIACVLSGGCVDIAAGGGRYVDTTEKRFAVTGQPSLTLSTFDGSINVNTWDRAEVVVRIEKHAVDKADADRIAVTAEQHGDVIEVRVEKPDRLGFMDFLGGRGAQLLVTVPVHARVDGSTGDGHLGVQSVQGDLHVRTGNGSIELEGVNGRIDASSGDGGIDIDGAIEQLHARSGDGHVRVRASSPIAASADWQISTGDGSVVVELPSGSGADLDATTGDGHVEVRGLPFDGATDRRARRTAHGRIGNGGGRVSIRTGDGSITVRPEQGGGR
jgi:DUF4097 and DUF4098 domain-containing protein YvlB